MPLREHASPGPIYDLSTSDLSKLQRSYSIGKAERPPINHGIEATPSPQHYKPKKIPTKKASKFPKAESYNP